MLQVPLKYAAFISYSHKDKIFAEWLHEKLETYVLPVRIYKDHKTLSRKPFTRCFLDQEEFSASISLPDNIETALKNSKFLIVICSVNSVSSRWVNEEIRRFKLLGKGDYIIPVMVSAMTLNTGEKQNDEEYFPYTLRQSFNPDGSLSSHKCNPLAVNFGSFIHRPQGPNYFLALSAWLKDRSQRQSGFIKLAAALLRIDYFELKRRDKIRQRIKRTVIITISGILTFIGTLLINNSLEASDRAEKAHYKKNLNKLNVLQQEAFNLGLVGEAVLWNIEKHQLIQNFRSDSLNNNHLIRTNFLYKRTPECIAYSLLDENEKMLFFDQSNFYSITWYRDSLFLMNLNGLKRSFLGKINESGNFTWLHWNKSRKQITFLNQNMKMQTWDIASDSFSQEKQISGFAMHPAGNYFVFRNGNGNLCMQNNEKRVDISLPGNATPFQFKFTKSGSFLIVSSNTRRRRIFLIQMNDKEGITKLNTISDWGEKEPFTIASWAVSEDESKIACKALDGSVTIFSIPSGKRLAGPYVGPDYEPFDDMCWAPDGHRIFLTRKNKLDVWEINENFRTSTLLTLQDEISNVVLSNDGAWLYCAAGDQIFTYNTSNWLWASYPVKINSLINNLALLPDNNLFIRTHKNECININSPDQESILKTVWKTPLKITNFQASTQDTYTISLQAGERQKIVTLIDNPDNHSFLIQSESPLFKEYLGHMVYLQQDSEFQNKRVYSYHPPSSESVLLLDIPFKEYPGMPHWAVSPSNEWLAAAQRVGNKAKIWNAYNKTSTSLSLNTTGHNKIVFSSNSSYVAFAGANGMVVIIDLTSNDFKKHAFKCALGLRDITFLPNNDEIAVATTSGEIQFWKLKSNQSNPAYCTKRDWQARKIEFNKDNKWFCALDYDARFLCVWNFENLFAKELCFAFPANYNTNNLPKIECYAIDSSRDLIWMADNNEYIAAWSLTSGEMIIPLLTLDGSKVNNITLRPNSSMVLFATDQGNIFEADMSPFPVKNLKLARKQMELLTGKSWYNQSGNEIILDQAARIEIAKELEVWKGTFD